MTTKNSKLPTSQATNAYDLLSDVRALILAEPKRYNQRATLERGHPSASRFPACGTIGCVAGWVYTLRPVIGVHPIESAQQTLGLDFRQADELFSGGAASWRPQTRLHAWSGAHLIRRFQRKYAAQLKKQPV